MNQKDIIVGIPADKARRLYLYLRDRIISGELAPQARLPGEPALASEHAVSRTTVRRALDQLAEDKLIERKPGAGTFIRGFSSAGRMVVDFANVFSHLQEMGRRTQVRLLSFGYGLPTAEVATGLGIPITSRVQRSVRVRLMDGIPFSYLVTHVPEAVGIRYTEAELGSTPLLELLERSGTSAHAATQIIGAAQAGPEVAEALGIPLGTALLTITRVVRSVTGQGVEHLYALYRPERYTLQMDLQRTEVNGTKRWTASSPKSRSNHLQ